MNIRNLQNKKKQSADRSLEQELEEKVFVGQISDIDINQINKKLANPKCVADNITECIKNVKKLKKEVTEQKIQKMVASERNMSQHYPCEYDYIVNQGGKYYLVYGWKQTMIDINLLPKSEKQQIMEDFNQNNKYKERVNRLPLTDLQLYMFEQILEDSLSTQIVEELQMLYRMKKIEPIFHEDSDGYQKKIFDSFVRNPQKFTIRVGGLRLDIDIREFFTYNNLESSICQQIQKRKINFFTCEMLISYQSIRQYRQTFNLLKAKGYDLQEKSKNNQTVHVLKYLKQMYAEVYANNYQQLNQNVAQKQNINKHLAEHLSQQEKQMFLDKQSKSNSISRSRSRSRSKSIPNSNPKSKSRSRSRSKSKSNSKSKSKSSVIQGSKLKLESKSSSSSDSKQKLESKSITNSEQLSESPSIEVSNQNICLQQAPSGDGNKSQKCLSPKPFRIPIVDLFDECQADQQEQILDNVQTVLLINEVQTLFTYLHKMRKNKKYKKLTISMTHIEKGFQMSPQQVLELNTKYFNIILEKNALTPQQEKEYLSKINLKVLSKFINTLKNQNIKLSDIHEFKLIK